MPRAGSVVEFRVEGYQEIQRKLADLGSKLGAKVLKQSARAAARPIVLDARSRVKPYSPETARALKVIKVRANPSRGLVTAVVGVPLVIKKGDRTFLSLWLEKGTGLRVQKRTGRRTGHQTARAFLGPALRAKSAEAVERFRTIVWERIEKYARG